MPGAPNHSSPKHALPGNKTYLAFGDGGMFSAVRCHAFTLQATPAAYTLAS